MKTFLLTLTGLRHSLLLGSFVAVVSVHAQSDYFAKTDSSKPYWKIQTDFASQKTLVRFFNNKHEPIYQETLAGRYVKLTNRNIRLFDSMLERLVTNQLLSAEVRSHELVPSSPGTSEQVVATSMSTPVTTVRILDSPKEVEEFGPMRSDLSISSTGKLKMHVLNLLEKPVLIKLTDDQGRQVFKEKSTLLNYNRTLNLARLPEGRFRLEVDSPQTDYTYRLLIQDNPRTYQLLLSRKNRKPFACPKTVSDIPFG